MFDNEEQDYLRNFLEDIFCDECHSEEKNDSSNYEKDTNLDEDSDYKGETSTDEDDSDVDWLPKVA